MQVTLHNGEHVLMLRETALGLTTSKTRWAFKWVDLKGADADDFGEHAVEVEWEDGSRQLIARNQLPRKLPPLALL